MSRVTQQQPESMKICLGILLCRGLVAHQCPKLRSSLCTLLLGIGLRIKLVIHLELDTHLDLDTYIQLNIYQKPDNHL